LNSSDYSPHISVIMPVYNGVRFVGKAIESVLAQDFQEWELVVVNDGSTDGTAEVLASFTDARIHVLSQPNSGEAVARNRALDAVSGEYVAFLDADDLYLPNALADMAAHLALHEEADGVCSDGYFCDEDERLLGRMSEVRPQVQPGYILEKLVIDSTVIGPPIFCMVRRACILQAHARFDPNLVIGPDWDFWIQLARHVRFDYLDRLTCMYRIHQNNITVTSGTTRRRRDLLRGRLKVLNADWFAELSLPTRTQFFYNLLIDLLADQPDQQDAIMAAPPFLALPAGAQANLLRLVASSYLGKRQNSEFALKCLRRSLELQPDSPKGRVLLQLGSRSPALAAAVLSVWQHAHGILTAARSFDQRKPKPVPAALMPKSG
jgi:glycosyltransferase involved in cell wall biosynthesis